MDELYRRKQGSIKINNISVGGAGINECCYENSEEEIFQEIEIKINTEIDLLIAKLEQIRKDSLKELAEQRERFNILESEWQLRGVEYSKFLQKYLELETKRNSIACLHKCHVETLSRSMKTHMDQQPRAPFIAFSFEREGILAKLEQTKLIVSVKELIAIPESRIKGWKSMPENIAIDHCSNHIYYSDPSNSCIREYTMEGEYIGELGLWSSEMVTPHSIAILKGGLYVSDLKLNCITKFNRINGKFERKTNKIIDFKSPIAITFSEKEELFVLDKLAKNLTVLNTDLEFICGYNLNIKDSCSPIDIKIREGKIYIMVENDIFWFEEPDKSLQVKYNYLNISITDSNHFCIDEVGNIIRTEANGILVVNAADGTELNRKSFDIGIAETSNLTGVCAVKNDWVVVGQDNRENILIIVTTS
ncbi:NHL repeat protein [Oopsacas minuta]|uniref:NHL repeat protein n=1 Tax=Oopsacas minuta TaxID=111878 RepID=A0AAV7JD74_9METZ|nr:NHL repeat protein [Oopsacas minuta]